MKLHAHFAPISNIQSYGPKKDGVTVTSNTASTFCFPTIESLLTNEKTGNITDSNFSSASKLSPYDILDNQFIFDNKKFTRNVKTAIISPRSLKSQYIVNDVISNNCHTEKKTSFCNTTILNSSQPKKLKTNISGCLNFKANRSPSSNSRHHSRKQSRKLSTPQCRLGNIQETFISNSKSVLTTA